MVSGNMLEEGVYEFFFAVACRRMKSELFFRWGLSMGLSVGRSKFVRLLSCNR